MKEKKRNGKKAIICLVVFLLTFYILSQYVLAEILPALRDSLPSLNNELKLDQDFKTNLFTGSFMYTYSLEVLPGTNDLQPQIDIFYASQKTTASPSVLGTAWDFTQTYIQRDLNYTINNASDDKFMLVLEGSSYDLVYVVNESRYHTKSETFLFVENKSAQNNEKGQYWNVKTRSGKTYRLGFNNDSEMVSQSGNFAWRLYVDLVTDTYNNSIFYSYLENPYAGETGATYLSNITYNNDRTRMINFSYENSVRQDLWTVYENGNKINQTRRLKEIGILYNNTLARKYLFDYQISDTNARTFLSNITLVGNDGITGLPPTSFNYHPVTVGFTNNSRWIPPICFKGLNDVDVGTRLADVNGDGLPDIIRGMKTSSCEPPDVKRAFINNGSGWVNNTNWTPPLCFSDSNGKDEGTRLEDVNGDGLVDIIRAITTSGDCTPETVKTFINNGTGWTENSTWNSPLCFTDGSGIDQGTRLFDINGDGLVDIIRGVDSDGNCDPPATKSAYINTGNGWVENSNWTPPLCFTTSAGVDRGTRTADLNGDGLVDFVRAVDTGGNCDPPATRKTYINTGNGWIEDVNLTSPLCFTNGAGEDAGTRFADINGDGLIDFTRSLGVEACEPPNPRATYINTGKGWMRNSTLWDPPLCIRGASFTDTGTRLADVNGDSLVDFIRSGDDSNCDAPTIKAAHTGNGTQFYLLSTVTNSLGGTLSVEYRNSTYLDNTGDDDISDLGFNLWVISSISQSNEMNGSIGVTGLYTYNFSGGFYDYKKKEFRGFAFSEETTPDNSKIRHYFHQDEARTGREFKIEILDSNNNLYQRKEFLWNFTINNSIFTAELREENASAFDGSNSSPKVIRIIYRYDNFGNVIEKTSLGNINVTGDEKYETFQYVYNTSSWIVEKLKNYILKASDNTTKLRETNYSYDNLSYGATPTKGDVTTKVDYLNTGTSPATSYQYDSRGNLIRLTDPNSRTTIYNYSANTQFTFPDNETNPKGHVTKYTYNMSLGKIASSTDPNGFVTSYTYDIFGRINKEIRPFDSISYPTKDYTYEFDGTPPEKIRIRHREQNITNNTFDSFYFYDGLGNVIQTKVEAENSQIVVNTFYDGILRTKARSNPYRINVQESYTEPSITVNRTNFTYDPMDRSINITNPDGTQKRFNYTRWNITLTDENGNRRMNVLDAYGQIIEVHEFNGNEEYITRYKYDAAGSLLNITDNLGNNFTFGYDTLGRKIRMIDPDMGTWNYTYDAAGNLIKQKDNRNVTTDFSYDELNRITRRNSSSEFYNYTYDISLSGTLSNVKGVNYTINFTYDGRLRKTNETKTVMGNTTKTGYTFDSMDRITRILLPNNDTINMTYNNQSRMDSIAGIILNIDYTELNNILARNYSNSLVTNFSYDPQNLRLTRIWTSDKQDMRYTYDNVSNVILINDTAKTRIYTMTYDSLNRLISGNINDVSLFFFNYTYNSIGNIIRVSTRLGNTTYSYGQSPVHAPSSITAPVNTNFTLQVHTLKDFYGENENVDLTDPPNGTNVILQDANNETLADTFANENAPNSEFGGLGSFTINNVSKFNEVAFIKFNISAIPAGSVIDGAYLQLKIQTNELDAAESYNVSVNHVYAFPNYNISSKEWAEGNCGSSSGCPNATGEMTWGNRPTSIGQMNLTLEDKINIANGNTGWIKWNVTKMVGNAISSGNKNITIRIDVVRHAGSDLATSDELLFESKDDTNAAVRPILNITYSEGTGGKTTPEANQSKIVNNGPLNASIYLLMKVQYYNFTSRTWVDQSTIINDTTARNLSVGETLALDTIWNPIGWNTSSNTRGAGTYRVWAAATDQNDIVLINANGYDVVATYNFIFNPIEASNLTVQYANVTQRIFRFITTNRNNETLNNVSWTFNNNQSTINSQLNVTLLANETIFNYIYYNYTGSGNYTVNATARWNQFSDSDTILIGVP